MYINKKSWQDTNEQEPENQSERKREKDPTKLNNTQNGMST